MYIYITGVPGKVPMVTITNNTDGNIVNFTLKWGEPFNNYDPIIMYHVSCSGDAPCPQSYNTTNNHTRSHTFTGFTPNSYYTFSVVAINSIGSGEAGVMMVGEIINTTTVPSVVRMTITTTIIYITSREDISMITSSESMTIGVSSEIMMTSTLTVDVVSTTMSSVSIAPTMTPTEDVTTAFILTVGMTVILYQCIITYISGVKSTTISASYYIHTSNNFTIVVV